MTESSEPRRAVGSAEGRPAGELPPVSVIIPHLNQPDQLDRCLESLARQSYPAERIETIVVDNGSNCDLGRVAVAHPGLTLLRESAPGPGLARNRGVSAARGEILAFIDADCVAHPDWIAALVAALEAPGSSGVVGGDVRILAADAGQLTPLQAYEAVFAFRQQLYIHQHGYSGTGNLAIRPAIFERVGPFGGIAIAEDMDWGRRAGAAGHPAAYCPGMIVYHPARDRFVQLQAKWQRHVAHQLEEHRNRKRPGWLWAAKAGAVLLSAIPHSLKLLTSDRLSGIGNRLRGVPVLFRIRAYRFAEMLRQARGTDTAAAAWNRG